MLRIGNSTCDLCPVGQLDLIPYKMARTRIGSEEAVSVVQVRDRLVWAKPDRHSLSESGGWRAVRTRARPSPRSGEMPARD